LVLGIVPGGVDGGAGGIGVEMVTDNYTSYWDGGGPHWDGGPPEPGYCHCLDHLVGLTCTQAYVLGPAQRNVTIRILREGTELGVCAVHLPEHNYCGFDATYLGIAVDPTGQVQCGAAFQFDICGR